MMRLLIANMYKACKSNSIRLCTEDVFLYDAQKLFPAKTLQDFWQKWTWQTDCLT